MKARVIKTEGNVKYIIAEDGSFRKVRFGIKENGDEVTFDAKRNTKLVSAVLVFFLVIGSVFGFAGYSIGKKASNKSDTKESTSVKNTSNAYTDELYSVYIDVNPSVKFNVASEKDKIVEVVPTNEDAEKLFDEDDIENYKDIELEEGLLNYIDLLEKNDYEVKNSKDGTPLVFITIASDNKNVLTYAENKLLQLTDGKIDSKVFKVSKKQAKIAEEKHVSPAKLVFAEFVTDDEEEYIELSKKPVKEIVANVVKKVKEDTKKDVSNDKVASASTKPSTSTDTSKDTSKDTKPSTDTGSSKNIKPSTSTDTSKDTKPSTSTNTSKDTSKDTKPSTDTGSSKNTKPSTSTDTSKDISKDTKPSTDTGSSKNTKPSTSTDTSKDTSKDTKPSTDTGSSKNTKPATDTDTGSSTDTGQGTATDTGTTTEEVEDSTTPSNIDWNAIFDEHKKKLKFIKSVSMFFNPKAVGQADSLLEEIDAVLEESKAITSEEEYAAKANELINKITDFSKNWYWI